MSRNAAVSFRLGQDTIDKLEHLSKHYGLSKAETLRVIIDRRLVNLEARLKHEKARDSASSA
jgi:predicted DNA-binding protein